MSKLVHLDCPGRTGRGASLTDMETGRQIPGVGAIDARVRIDEAVTVTAQIHVQSINMVGVLFVKIPHPVTGELKLVKSITWEDGTVFEC